AGEVHPVPDHLLDRARPLAVEAAGDPQDALVLAFLHRDRAVAVLDEGAEVGMGETLAEGQLAVEVVLVAGLALVERDDHVGVALLRADEGRRVLLATLEVSEHLGFGVAAASRVAGDLPP